MLNIPITHRPVRDDGGVLPSREAVAEMYEDMEQTIRDTARRFAKKYRTDPEDTEAEARYLFLEAIRTHNPERGSLENRIKHFVWLRLHEIVRLAAQQFNHCPRVNKDVNRERSRVTATYNIGDLLRELNEDGKQVAVLLLEPTPDLDGDMIAQESTVLKRRTLRTYLEQKLGWTVDRINDAFREVRNIL